MARARKKILANGEIRWIIQVTKKGYKRHFISKVTQAAAEREHRKVLRSMEEGTWDEFASEEQRKGNTPLEHFIKRYLSEVSPHKEGGKKGIINETSVLNQVLASPLGKMNVYHIKTGHIIELRNKWRNKGNEASTINRKITPLQDVFTHIIRDWRHESLQNPVIGTRLSHRKKGSYKIQVG